MEEFQVDKEVLEVAAVLVVVLVAHLILKHSKLLDSSEFSQATAIKT